MFYSRSRATIAVKSVLDRYPGRDSSELADMCVNAVLSMPLQISQRVIDLALEAYDPSGITQLRRERMRTALEAAFNGTQQ